MYAAERQQRILTEARRAGRVEVAALADSLGVAAETVRRDLTALERRGSLRRVHGGAIPVERLELEPTLATRSTRLTEVKRRIAARVLDELPTGGTVLLDSGSTTLAVVELLPPDADLTVLTNSVAAAAVLSTHPGVTLYLLGGRVRGVTGAAVGEWATRALDGVTVDLAVLGTNGISAGRGLTTPDQAEALVKRAMVRAARRVVVATDSTKAGDDHLHRFAELADVDLVVTDADLDDDVAAELRAAGPEVVTA
jgi:DeoR family fructose operon transcriptional repressor